MEWMNPEKTLPKLNSNVLLVVGKRKWKPEENEQVFIGRYVEDLAEKEHIFIDENGWKFEKVSHWLSIPELT